MLDQIQNTHKIIIKIILAVVAFISCAVLGLYGTVMMMFSGAGKYGFFVAGICLLFFILFCLILFWKSQRKVIAAILAAIVGACILSAAVAFGYITYMSKIPIVNSSDFIVSTTAAAVDGVESARNVEPLLISGDKLLYPMYEVFAKKLRKTGEYANSGINIDYSFNVYDNLLFGGGMYDADIVFVISPAVEIKDVFHDKDGKKFRLKFTPVAKEAFVFFVNKDNPVNNLGKAELTAIYSAEITNWEQIGGQNRRIKAYADSEPSGITAVLKEFVKARNPGFESFNNGFTGRKDISFESYVYKNYKGAIGFASRYFINSIADEKGVKILALDGIYPSNAAVETGDYPLAYYVYAVTREEVAADKNAGSEKSNGIKIVAISGYYASQTSNTSNKNTDAALKFMLSPEGQDIVEKSGYVRLRKKPL